MAVFTIRHYISRDPEGSDCVQILGHHNGSLPTEQDASKLKEDLDGRTTIWSRFYRAAWNADAV